MKQYSISYDLRAPGRNYDNLYKAIKALGGGWCHTLESLWMVKSNLSAEGVRDQLLPHIDKNDGLIVCELSGAMAWYGIASEQSNWLRSA